MSTGQTQHEDAQAVPGTAPVSGNVLARNTTINFVGRIVPLVVGVTALPYTIRHLGPDRFGLLSLVWIVVGYFALFNLGIGPATTKFVAELLGRGEEEKLAELVWTATLSQASLGLLGGLLLSLVTPFLVDHLLKIPPELLAQGHFIFLMLAFVLPVDFAAGSLGGVLSASQRFDLVNAVAVPARILNYLLPVGALALGYGLPGIVLFLVLARIGAFAVAAALCFRLYPCLRAGFPFNPRLARQLLGFGGWVTVSGIVSPILVSFDRFFIGSALSIGAVGFYTPPYVLSDKLSILPGSLIETLFPAFSNSTGRGDGVWIKKTMARSLKYLILTVGPSALVLIFFARPVLTFWLGARFATEGALVLQIFAVGALTNALARVPWGVLLGIGRPDLVAKLHLVELPIHIVLALLLVTRMGLPGAALAWTIRASLEFIALTAAACWLTRTPARFLAGEGLRRSVETLGALALGLAGLWRPTHDMVVDAVVSVLLGSGFLVAAWHYVLDSEERWQIRLWLKALR